jgi:hypothetical protein
MKKGRLSRPFSQDHGELFPSGKTYPAEEDARPIRRSVAAGRVDPARVRVAILAVAVTQVTYQQAGTSTDSGADQGALGATGNATDGCASDSTHTNVLFRGGAAAQCHDCRQGDDYLPHLVTPLASLSLALQRSLAEQADIVKLVPAILFPGNIALSRVMTV